MVCATVMSSAAGVSDPATATRVVAKGLDAQVEILIDQWGVPHIFAASRRDAFFAQGWNAAQAALYEIWIARHLGAAVTARLIPAVPKSIRAAASGTTPSLVEALEHPDSRWGADPERARDTAMLRSLRSAVADFPLAYSREAIGKVTQRTIELVPP